MAWQEVDNKLVNEWAFKNFSEAFGFVSRVGLLAEQMNHHPDIHLTGYKHVRIETTTHDAGNTITELDRQMAEAIDRMGGARG